MKRTCLLPEGMSAFKANLHCHSTFSDGVMSPQELKALYTSQGYSIVAYTDHHAYRYHESLADESFLPLAGYELNFDESDVRGRLRKTCHINAIAIDPKKATPIEGRGTYTADTVNSAVRRLSENGFVAILNHPAWSNQSPEEVAGFEGFAAMELYNSVCSRTYNIAENQLHYEACLRAGKRCLAVFADDNHASCNALSPSYPGAYHSQYARLPRERILRVPSMDSCRGYIVIYAPVLSYGAVMDSFIGGRYYCSTGPAITSCFIEDGAIRIECSPVRAIFLKTRAWGVSSSVLDSSGGITHAEFDFQRLVRNDEGYFRLELVDRNGEMASTNPYYF